LGSEIQQYTDKQLATNAEAEGWKAYDRLAELTSPAELASFTHDIKAIRDRVSKLQLDRERAFEALFPWSVAWLAGMRSTGKAIVEGQEAGTIHGPHDSRSGNKLLLEDMGLDKIQSSRWQRLAEIDDEDFRTWYEEAKDNREQPTFSRLMAIWRKYYKDPEWEELPEGTFSVVYADPPWDFSNEFTSERKGETADQQYPTVSTTKICELPVAGKAPVLYLWVPNALMMRDGRMVLEAWGYQYKTCMVWMKPKGPSMGWWLENRHEMLLIGTTADAHPPINRSPSVIEAPVNGHSRKPDEFYNAIEKAFDGPYLELFARRQHNEQWTTWGNEAPTSNRS
jgi:N6-adenosine-specific RNA methylase IME4